jgi:hypothetical protein
MNRIDVYTNADGDHVRLLIDGVASSSRLFTSRSMDPANPAVWLDGRRVYGVEVHWNGTYQFGVPEAAEAVSPPQTSGAPTSTSS